MLKKISNLGNTLTKEQQKTLIGGIRPNCPAAVYVCDGFTITITNGCLPHIAPC